MRRHLDGLTDPSRKTGFLEEREPFKTRDRNGKTVLCFKCRKAPSAPLQSILSCDFCDLHWHLDCLDPPLLTLPPAGHRWMCPLHTEQSTRRARVPKHQQTVTVSSGMVANAGEVDIVLSNREASPEWEELSVNGVRYQVPEEVVILDFLGALRGEQPKCVEKRTDELG